MLDHVGLASTGDFAKDVKMLYNFIYGKADKVTRQHVLEMLEVQLQVQAHILNLSHDADRVMKLRREKNGAKIVDTNDCQID